MREIFKLHDSSSAPSESKQLLEKVRASSGMIPGLYAVLAESPEALKAYVELGKIFGQSSLSDDEKTVVWQTINVEHECKFCVPAHTLVAKLMKVDETITNALRNKTLLPNKKLEKLREFTLILVRNRGKATEEEVSAFIEAGFTRKNILEVIVGISQKVLSNYTNYIAKTPLNKEFKPFAW
tara:strand:+ start:83 stop:628 length:546 start_codon:yes stop_codon:yes gene_type:complete